MSANEHLSPQQFEVEHHQEGASQTLVYKHPKAPGNSDRGLEEGWAGTLTYHDRGDSVEVFSRVTDKGYRKQGVATTLQDHLEGVAAGRPITSRQADMSGDATRFHASYQRRNADSTWRIT